MTPLRIEGATRLLAATIEGFDYELSVCEGDGWTYAAFEPLPDELALLNSGGRVIVAMNGAAVDVWVEPHAAEILQGKRP